MDRTETVRVSSEDDGKRLDVFASEAFSQTRSFIQNSIENGLITVNGGDKPKNYKVSVDDEVSIVIPPPRELNAEAEDIPIDIVYEDEHLLVVNKPQGMVVHPAAGHYEGTLVNALLAHCKGGLSGINGTMRPGIVHRIDKDTAGLLIVAKTDQAHKALAEQIAKHSFGRKYEAVVFGNMKEDAGVIDLPIGRHKTDRKKMAVTELNSRNAVTYYRTIARYSRGNKTYTHLELTLETGRTHQIRVHLSHLGHPVLGDPVYGSAENEFGLTGQCLFAKYISFVHPMTGDIIELEAERPEFFNRTLSKLKG